MTPGFFTIMANMVLAAVLGGVFHHLKHDPRWLWADWSVTGHIPFPVMDQMELARAGGRLKTGSLSAVCEAGAVRLVLRKRLILNREDRWTPRPRHAYDTRTFIYLGRGAATQSFETGSSLVERGYIDTIVTAALTVEQRDLLLAWYERGAPARISFQTLENAAFNKAVAHHDDVAAFLERCSGSRMR